MASIQSRKHKDGSVTHRVLWRDGGRQRSLTFEDITSAEGFRSNIDAYGSTEALAILDITDTSDEQTLGEWVDQYVDTLAGIGDGTRKQYRRYAAHDLAALRPATTGDHRDHRQEVAPRPRSQQGRGQDGAEQARIPVRRAEGGGTGRAHRPKSLRGQRIKRTERREMVMLSRDEFDQVHAAIGRELWSRPRDVAGVDRYAVPGGDQRCAPPTSTSMPAPAGSPARGNGPNKGGGRSAEDAAVGAHINLPAPAVDVARRRAADGGEYMFVNGAGSPVRQQNFFQRGMERSPQASRAEDSAHPRSAPHLRLLDDRRRVPLVVVSRHLGHEDITTTANTYSHVDRASGKAAADAISKILGWNA